MVSIKRSPEVFLRVSAKIKAPSSFINVNIVIKRCSVKLNKDNNNDNNNYPTTAILIHLL